MRRVLFLVALLALAGATLGAQERGASATGSVPSSLEGGTGLAFPIGGYGFTQTAVDKDGNLLLIEPSYSFDSALGQAFVPRSRVSIVPFGQLQIASTEYVGYFQGAQTGRKAVYVLASATSAFVLGQSATPSAALLAINAGAAAVLPASLPSHPLQGLGDIKVVPGDLFDTIYVIEQSFFGGPVPLGATNSSNSFKRTLQVVRFNGTAFTVVGSISLP